MCVHVSLAIDEVWQYLPRGTTKLFKVTSLLKLPLDPRNDAGHDLVIIHALQRIKPNVPRSFLRTVPYESTDAQYLQLPALARRILDLAHETLSKPEKAVELILCLVDVLFFLPKAWQGQLMGEAGLKMRILGGSDVQDIAIDVDAESQQVWYITEHHPCVYVVEELCIQKANVQLEPRQRGPVSGPNGVVKKPEAMKTVEVDVQTRIQEASRLFMKGSAGVQDVKHIG
jgi:hypothetical protein